MQPQNLISLPAIARPDRFRSPTIEECQLHAAKIGLALIEAEKFFHFYTSNGWRVGRNLMRSWHSAMSGWKCRCGDSRNGQSAPNGADKIIWQKELDRILQKIKVIRENYGDHQTKTQEDQLLLQRLVARKKELMGLLGVML